MSSSRLCAIHQPNFFPRLSTLAKLHVADVWVVLDDVQYNGRDYQNRCRLARLNAPPDWQWLSLPVHRPQGRHSRIVDVRLIEPSRSKDRAVRLVKHFYRQSPYWPVLETVLQSVLDVMDNADRVADVAETSTLALLHLLGWHGHVQHSRELDSSNERSQRLADLTAAVGAATYLCGTGGRHYLDTAAFTARGLDIAWFEPPHDASHHDRPVIWSQARRLSALWALARFGPTAVQNEFDKRVQRPGDGRSPAKY